MKPPKVADPLPSAALEQDAREAGVEADQATARGRDDHLPASESEQLSGEGESAEAPRNPEENLTKLPPG